MATRTVKYLTRALLLEAANLAEKNDYNQQPRRAPLERLSDGLRFPIVFAMVHEHRAGKLVAPHMRIMVALFNTVEGITSSLGRVLIDVPMSFYESLPEVEVPGHSA